MALLFKWTCLLALGWAAHGLLRRRHARWRLILWRGILCLGLALPLARFCRMPAVKIPIAVAAVEKKETVAMPAQVAQSEAGGGPISSEANLAGTDGTDGTDGNGFHLRQGYGGQAAEASPHRGMANPARISPPSKPVPWESILLWTWAAGCGCGAFRLFRMHLQLFRLRRETCRPSPDLQRLARQIQVRLQAGREVDVRISDAVTSPFICGLMNPVIIVPAGLAQQLPESELAALLSHEIAHLRQNDLVWCVAWRWMKAVCWFHPLVWKAPAVHNLACEQEADRIASRHLAEEDSYPRLLARLALRVLALPPVETKLTLNGSSQIAWRLIHLGQKGVDAWNWKRSAAGLGLVGLLFLMSAGFDFSKASPATFPVKIVQSDHVLPPVQTSATGEPASPGLPVEPEARLYMAQGSAAPEPDFPNESTLPLTIELRDGSRLVGKSLENTLSFHSPALGDFMLNWAGIRSVEYGETNAGLARLTATNGDLFIIQPAAGVLRVETGFGRSELPVKLIRSVKVSGMTSQAGGPAFNIHFGPGKGEPSKQVGPAAVGQEGDFWNTVAIGFNSDHTETGLKLANGQPSPIEVQMINLGGAWGSSGKMGVKAQMLDSFNYPVNNQGGNSHVILSHLPAGKYSLYIYGHGASPSYYGDYTVSVGGRDYGRKKTSENPELFQSTDWVEDGQYVRFQSVEVSDGEKIEILIRPGGVQTDGGRTFADAIISGLQLVPVL
jgi:beta-lactamase regulating signal transducer with metallopeptidase domain